MTGETDTAIEFGRNTPPTWKDIQEKWPSMLEALRVVNTVEQQDSGTVPATDESNEQSH